MKTAIISIAAALVIYLGLSIFGAIAVMEIPRLPVNESPESHGLGYQDVTFTSRGKSVLLRGWYLTGGSGFCIIIVHGGFQNRVDDNVNTLGLAQDLVAAGYDLLLFDLRGRGESEGKGRSLSHIEHDIGGAVDYLKGRGYSGDTIGIIGFCSGAASACIFASQEDVSGLVLDGCFSDVPTMFIRQAAMRHIPQWLVRFFMPGVLAMVRLIYGYELINPVDVIGSVGCPVLLIHEQYDELITLEDTYRLYNAAPNEANQVWEVSGTEHSHAYRRYPAIFIDKIASFFARK